MASRKTPSTYIATNYQIFFDIATTEVAESRGGGHAIRSAYNIELSARSGVETTDFGVYSVQAYIYGSRKTPSTYIATNYQNILRYCTTGRIAWRRLTAIRSAYNIEGKKRVETD